MAKSKTVNKSQVIRDALAKHPDKSPAEISELLKAQGLKLSPQYVSTIKSNAKRSGGKAVRASRNGRHRRAGGQEVGNGMVAINAAVEFIQRAGGLEAAKAALGTVEQIKNL